MAEPPHEVQKTAGGGGRLGLTDEYYTIL